MVEHDRQELRRSGEQEGQGGRRYHHGDLRRALLDAALQLASERGIAGFTLREVARLAGVSHNAPYHHFVDKATLVAALVIENFEMLQADLHAAYQTEQGTALDKLKAIGVVYVRFALQHPAAFRLMFRPELHRSGHDGEQQNEAIQQAGSEAYNILLDTIRAAQQASLIASTANVQLLSIAAWSTMHGLAVLLLDASITNLLPAPLDDELLAGYIAQVLIDGVMKH